MELFAVSRRQVDGRFVEIADFATARVNVHHTQDPTSIHIRRANTFNPPDERVIEDPALDTESHRLI
jgi:hypothetical protein